MSQAPRIVRWTLPALLLTLVIGGALIVSSSGIGDSPKSSEAQPRTATTPARQRKSRRVTVRAGDTASAIAQRARLSLNELLDLNPRIEPSTLRPGQKLKIAP